MEAEGVISGWRLHVSRAHLQFQAEPADVETNEGTNSREIQNQLTFFPKFDNKQTNTQQTNKPLQLTNKQIQPDGGNK